MPSDIASGTDILFDITHGFRSMPLLIFQSLQLNASKIVNKKIDLIYGEYIEAKKISYVRDLSQYWDYYEISSAIKLFEEKLDGKLLAEKIKPFWEKGAKFIIRLSEIVECNFSLQIPDALNELKNALKNYSDTENQQWVNDVWKMLNDEIYKNLIPNEKEPYPIAVTVWNYSKLLRKKNLITQAVIALHVAMETVIAEEYDNTRIGDYGWFNGYYDAKKSQKIEGIGDKRLKEVYQKNPRLGSKLDKLEGLRNQIAHGGGKNKKGEYPHQANIKGILDPMDAAIQELINELI
jgi:CRISPR-associated DxTHG motif protein